MENLLIIGRSGQLARALQRSCRAQNIPFSVIGSDTVDLAQDPEAIAEIIRRTEATAVINASAYTQVDGAETDIVRARNLNAKAPAVMAAACKARDVPWVHISTDYVFDGKAGGRPHRPTDTVNPLNVYGSTKAAGERAILAAGGRATILRTSWVYDGRGKNFLTTMLRLGQERESLSIVADQIGRPTYAGHLAECCLKVLSRTADKSAPNRAVTPQIFHVSDSGTPISWKDFALAIFKAAHVHCDVKPIPTRDYPTPAQRPLNSVMDISDFERVFAYPLMPWRDGLALALSERDDARS